METTVARLVFGERFLDRQIFSNFIVRVWRRYILRAYKAEVARGYDAAAPYYDEWVWQSLWHKTEWPVLRSVLMEPRQPCKILEIGIGTGAVAKRIFAEVPSVSRYVGIDVSEGMLAQCRNLQSECKVELINKDVVSLDFASLGGEFDFVLSCRMIGHLRNPGEIFRKVREILTGDGRFVVTDIDPGHDYVATRLPTHRGRVEVPTFKHQPADVISAAERAGLRLDRFYRIYADEALARAEGEGPSSLAGRRGPLFNLFVFKQGPGLTD